MTEFWARKIYTLNGFQRQNILEGKKALDVGCGERKLPGATGMDVRNAPGVDVIHDANLAPWPFGDNFFDLVLFNQSLEHLENVEKSLLEARRVLKNKGRIVVQVPFFRSPDAKGDPAHRHIFDSRSLNFIPNSRFIILKFWYGWPHPSKNPIRQIFKNFIHRFPVFYDRYLSVLIPVECLTWELEVKK